MDTNKHESETVTRTVRCPFCGVRPPRLFDAFDHRNNAPHKDYCDECHQAHRIAHTSVDDARQSIRNETSVDVIYMAARVEKERPIPRVSFLNMLRARLSKLTGLRTPQLWPHENVS
jgi:hypothetical protein